MKIKALTFDTGGTILDWHSAIHDAFQRGGDKHGIVRDWHAVTNDYRRAAMQGIVGRVQPAFNMDDVHASALDKILAQHELRAFAAGEREAILRAWHELAVWPDFPAALARIRHNFEVVSFTMLPLRLVIDVSRRNGIGWDAVISCEMIGMYKPNPASYQRVSEWLDLQPENILMVACHNFDLDAARSCGFRTAFVKRPAEWGPAGPPDPDPHPGCDIVVDDFMALAEIFDTSAAAINPPPRVP